jgi:DNA-binding SARP family transcriptional activator
VSLLGSVEIRLRDGSPVRVASRKALALLAYLALRPGEAQARGKLAALLWGDAPKDRARHSVRQALATIRTALGRPGVRLLTESGDLVALDPAAVEVDVVRFEALATSGAIEALEQATTLYRGDLAEGLDVSEPAFEEWLLTERFRLREQTVEVLARLLAHHVKTSQTDLAIQTAVRLLGLDPLQESVHRTLMRVYAGQGRRGAALRQYQACLAVIRRELGTDPEPETRTLYLELLQRTVAEPAGAIRAAGPRRRDGGPGSDADVAGGPTPLIGRAVELEWLERARKAAWRGKVALAIVTGEAGIGKSRLVTELTSRAAADGGRVLLGRAYEGEQLPFGPWVDALRNGGLVAYAQQSDAVGASWRVELARLFAELGPARPEPPRSEDYVRLFEAVGVLLRAAAEREPLVIVLEDLHWTDTLSIRLLVFLRRQLAGAPVLLVATAREEEIDTGHPLRRVLADTDGPERIDRIELAGLNRADTLALVHAAARAGTDRAAIARLGDAVWQASDGNPLVIVETMRAFEGGDLPASGTLPLPRRVKEIVQARLERLGERARSVLAVAAVIGRGFDFGLLQVAAGRNARETAEAVEELVGRRVLHAVGERLDFTHDRFRQVAYGCVLPTTRLVLHRAVGEALERLLAGRLDEAADQLGHHYFQAGETRKAVAHLARFAELAAQRYALDDALAALRQAGAAADRLPAAGRDRVALDIALRRAFVLSLLGRQREVLELVRAHEGHRRRVGDATLRSEYDFRVAITHFYVGEHAEAHAAAERALEEGERAGAPAGIGKALHVLALSSYGLGRPRRGMEYARRAVSMLDRPQTQHWLGLVHHDLALNAIAAGDLDCAIEAAERCRAVGVAAGDARLIAEAGYVGAWSHSLRGDHDLAVEVARRAVETSRDPMASSLTSGMLGMAMLARGEAAAAIGLLEQAVERLSSIPVRSAVARLTVFLGEAYLLLGDRGRARDVTRGALAMSQAGGSLLTAGLAERLLGRIAVAERDVARALRHLAQALETFARCEAALEGAMTRLLLAEVHHAAGDPAAARQHLAAACQGFTAANAPRRVAAARELARTLGIDAPASISRPGAPLSARRARPSASTPARRTPGRDHG